MGSGGQIKVRGARPARHRHLLLAFCACAILNGLLSLRKQTGAWDPEEDDLLYYWQVIWDGFPGQPGPLAAAGSRTRAVRWQEQGRWGWWAPQDGQQAA
jgi:hypothetical protein